MDLIQACKAGDRARAVALLNAGADHNAVDQDRRSAAWWGATEGHIDIVRLLRGRGADFNQRDNYGLTPFLGAC